MNPVNSVSQFFCLIRHGLKAELADKERLLTPLLLAITILLLFNFVFDEQAPELQAKFFVAEAFLSLLFALQTSYARLFAIDEQDRVFELLQTSPLSPTAWFLGKYALTLITSLLIVIPSLAVASLFHSRGLQQLSAGVDQGVLLVIALALLGLNALGILLAAITMKASGREVLFPLLYFPLAVPVLLASSQASLAFMAQGQEAWQWLGLLAGFDIIYFTLGILLFGELVTQA